jgi:hypothetical protein
MSDAAITNMAVYRYQSTVGVGYNKAAFDHIERAEGRCRFRCVLHRNGRLWGLV